jgi:hypothetical protein
MHPGMHEYLLTGCAATGARFVTTRQKNNPSHAAARKKLPTKKNGILTTVTAKTKISGKNSAVAG